MSHIEKLHYSTCLDCALPLKVLFNGAKSDLGEEELVCEARALYPESPRGLESCPKPLPNPFKRHVVPLVHPSRMLAS